MNLTAPICTAPSRTAPAFPRTFAALGALALLAALSGCATQAPTPDAAAGGSASATAPAQADTSTTECAGVNVVVDFSVLDADSITACVDTAEATAARDVLRTAGVTTEGSVEYGDQIVCRVNGRPAADEMVEIADQDSFTESCASMPPAYAYWALWVAASPDADWSYAQEGLGTLEVKPGQSVGLVYTTGTETPTPGS